MAVTAITANKDTAPTTAPTTRLLERSGVSAGEIRAKKNVKVLQSLYKDGHIQQRFCMRSHMYIQGTKVSNVHPVYCIQYLK